MRGRKELDVFVVVCDGVFVWRHGVSVSCLEGVGGCEGANGFDDGRELRFGGICSPRAGACAGFGVVGK